MSTRPSFYIIDGHAHIYRAFFAPFRDLTSPTGEPTKATFVFTQMLLNLVEQRKPDYLAVVIDHGDETVFRREIYPEYKANRPPPPPEFAPQEERILQIIREMGLPLYEAPGYEADDLIATMVDKLQHDFDLFLVSKDKDLRQLLTPHVRLYDPVTQETVTPEHLRATRGYGPEQSIDIQTLIGDATDNVPGIPGVGEKTAAQLLNEFGSIDNIYASIDKLKSKKKLVENLLAYRDKLPLSRTLVTLKRDVPFDFDAAACKFGAVDVRVKPTLEMLGFRSLSARLGTNSAPVQESSENSLFSSATTQATPASAPAPASAPETSVGLPYRCIDTLDALDAFVVELSAQKRFAFDTETTSENPTQADLVGLSFSWAPTTGAYIPVRGPMGAKVLDEALVLSKLRPILEDPHVGKVGHNIKYDLLVMRRAGIHVRGVVSDTMLAAFLLDASRNSYGIDPLSLQLLNFKKVATVELIGSGKNQSTMDQVDVATVSHYASEDVDITWRLDQLFQPQLDAIPAIRKLFDELEVPLIDVIADMEHAGIRVDPAVLKQQSNVLGERITRLFDELMREAGTTFNPDSPKQLADLLFNKLKLPPGKKTKTGYSTDVEVLEKLAIDYAVPKLILEYRSLQKLKNTYLDNLVHDIHPRDGRIHTSFNITGAATGRLSSSNPNLQNIPIRTDEGRRIRLAFVAEPGHVLLSADYAQIELRVLAHFTQEPALLRSFSTDEDVHKTVAAEVFGVPLDAVTKDQRNQAKIVNFGIIYGVTASGLARRIDGMTVSAAADLIKRYNQRFPGIEKFMRDCVEHARSKGYVETILGRRRPLPDIHSAVINIRNMNERMAINSVVQGSAADLIKQAMLNLARRIEREKLPARLLLQVHDELVLESPTAAAPSIAKVVEEEMTGAMTLRVPLKVEVGVGNNWGEGKS